MLVELHVKLFIIISNLHWLRKQTFIVISDRLRRLCFFIFCFIVCRITQKVVDGFSDEIFQISTHSANLD